MVQTDTKTKCFISVFDDKMDNRIDQFLKVVHTLNIYHFVPCLVFLLTK